MPYKITDTAQVPTLSPRGTPKEVWKVWIQTSRGSTGSIEVDPEDWTPEKLKSILGEFAAKLDMAFHIQP